MGPTLRTCAWLALGGVLFASGCKRAVTTDLDWLAPLRDGGAVEAISTDGVWVWHEFQYAEPCRVVTKRLAGWKSRAEASGRRFAMTDMDDRKTGVNIWARPSELIVRPAVDLKGGRNCGFAVGLEKGSLR